MDLEAFEKKMKELLDEFEQSGRSVDDFIREKFAAAGHQNADAEVEEIANTLSEIDRKFASLQQFKDEGGNREEWLRQEMDEIAEDYSPEEVGKVLSSTEKVLNGDEDDTPDEGATYDGLDAVFAIRNLDNALVKNTCVGLNGKEEE